MPPLGPLYGQTVFVDAELALEPEIVFSGGTHREAIAIRWNDFVKMVNPIVGRLAEPSVGRVPDYQFAERR
jgi:Ala-tRNA(Pro) deacylase